MSNNNLQSQESVAMSGKSINPNQSSWISHWMQTSYTSPPHISYPLPLRYKSMEEGHDIKQSSLHADPEISSDISKPGLRFRELAGTNPIKGLNENSRSSNKSKLDINNHSFPIFNLGRDRDDSIYNDRNHLPSMDPPLKPENSLKGHVQSEGTSENFGQLVEYQHFLEKNRLPGSRSFQGNLLGSSSNVVRKNSPLHSFVRLPESMNQVKENQQNSNVMPVDDEPDNYHKISAASTSLLGKNDRTLVLHDPSTNNDQVPYLFGGPYKKLLQQSDTRFFASQNSVPIMNKSEHFNPEFYSQQTSPMFKGSSASKKFSETISLSPDFENYGRPGLIVPMDSEGNKKIEDVKTSTDNSKNESSAETVIMDMDAFKQKYHLTDIASSSQTKTELPDMNEEPPVQFAEATPLNEEPITSTTQSLDVDHLLSNAINNTANCKSIISSIHVLGPEPGSRWVKRLKMSPPNSVSHGTKSLKLEESSHSHEKTNTYLPTKINQTAIMLESSKVEEFSLSHSWVRRWCRGQIGFTTQKNNNKAVVVCEPQSLKTVFEDMEKKQFPSIAAMALLGKAMNGFRPCEFRKRGSFVVWNTKEL